MQIRSLSELAAKLKAAQASEQVFCAQLWRANLQAKTFATTKSLLRSLSHFLDPFALCATQLANLLITAANFSRIANEQYSKHNQFTFSRTKSQPIITHLTAAIAIAIVIVIETQQNFAEHRKWSET